MLTNQKTDANPNCTYQNIFDPIHQGSIKYLVAIAPILLDETLILKNNHPRSEELPEWQTPKNTIKQSQTVQPDKIKTSNSFSKLSDLLTANNINSQDTTTSYDITKSETSTTSNPQQSITKFCRQNNTLKQEMNQNNKSNTTLRHANKSLPENLISHTTPKWEEPTHLAIKPLNTKQTQIIVEESTNSGAKNILRNAEFEWEELADAEDDVASWTTGAGKEKNLQTVNIKKRKRPTNTNLNTSTKKLKPTTGEKKRKREDQQETNTIVKLFKTAKAADRRLDPPWTAPISGDPLRKDPPA
jgi:hypothetical protein